MLVCQLRFEAQLSDNRTQSHQTRLLARDVCVQAASDGLAEQLAARAILEAEAWPELRKTCDCRIRMMSDVRTSCETRQVQRQMLARHLCCNVCEVPADPTDEAAADVFALPPQRVLCPEPHISPSAFPVVWSRSLSYHRLASCGI